MNATIDNKITDIIKGSAVQRTSGQRRYIITGGPGVGKTSIINYLAKLGYVVMPEAATDIIEEGLRQNIVKPWRADDYHIKVYALIAKRKQETQNSNAPIIFFDRGHIDGISYILLQKRKLHQQVIDCVQTSMDTQFFDKKVFLIESLGFVRPGPARTETLDESLEKARHLEMNYRALGYEIIRIPMGTVPQRAKWIIDHTQNGERD